MKIGNIFNRSSNILAFLGGIVIIWVMLIVTAQVFMRYFLRKPIFWVPEVSEISMLYILFLGTAWVLKKEGHIKMDMLLDRLNLRTRTTINFITSILGTISCLVLTFSGAHATWKAWELGLMRHTVLDVPTYIIIAIVPVGSFFLFTQFIRRTRDYLERLRISSDTEHKFNL
ncbi:TRAP transporter small permease [Chloroflexota bacterium]